MPAPLPPIVGRFSAAKGQSPGAMISRQRTTSDPNRTRPQSPLRGERRSQAAGILHIGLCYGYLGPRKTRLGTGLGWLWVSMRTKGPTRLGGAHFRGEIASACQSCMNEGLSTMSDVPPFLLGIITRRFVI